MKIKFVSVMVDDQEHALEFYTTVLGFTKMADIDMGEYRWLTVTSPDGIEGVELVLEPTAFSPAQVYRKALYEAGIPATALIARDIAAEVERLKSLGVVFRGEPVRHGPITSVTFDGTAGGGRFRPEGKVKSTAGQPPPAPVVAPVDRDVLLDGAKVDGIAAKEPSLRQTDADDWPPPHATDPDGVTATVCASGAVPAERICGGRCLADGARCSPRGSGRFRAVVSVVRGGSAGHRGCAGVGALYRPLAWEQVHGSFDGYEPGADATDPEPSSRFRAGPQGADGARRVR